MMMKIVGALWAVAGIGIGAVEERTEEVEQRAGGRREFWTRLSGGRLRTVVEVLPDEADLDRRASLDLLEYGFASVHGFGDETEDEEFYESPGVSHLLEHLALWSMPHYLTVGSFVTGYRQSEYALLVGVQSFLQELPIGEFARGILDTVVDCEELVEKCIGEVDAEWEKRGEEERMHFFRREITNNLYRRKKLRVTPGNKNTLKLPRVCTNLAKFKTQIVRPERGVLVVTMRKSVFVKYREELDKQMRQLDETLEELAVKNGWEREGLIEEFREGSHKVETPWKVKGKRITTVSPLDIRALYLDFEIDEPDTLANRSHYIVARMLKHPNSATRDSLLSALARFGVQQIEIPVEPGIGERLFSIQLRLTMSADISSILRTFFMYVRRFQSGALSYAPLAAMKTSNLAAIYNDHELDGEDAARTARDIVQYGLRKAVVGRGLPGLDFSAAAWNIFRPDNFNIREEIPSFIRFPNLAKSLLHPVFDIRFLVDNVPLAAEEWVVPPEAQRETPDYVVAEIDALALQDEYVPPTETEEIEFPLLRRSATSRRPCFTRRLELEFAGDLADLSDHGRKILAHLVFLGYRVDKTKRKEPGARGATVTLRGYSLKVLVWVAQQLGQSGGLGSLRRIQYEGGVLSAKEVEELSALVQKEEEGAKASPDSVATGSFEGGSPRRPFGSGGNWASFKKPRTVYEDLMNAGTK